MDFLDPFFVVFQSDQLYIFNAENGEMEYWINGVDKIKYRQLNENVYSSARHVWQVVFVQNILRF
ncbi:hypothetical protein B6I21_08260 [candidate division KSB1 bacterium 4572_119]|nr:MAG: hypothetical protein B6I21_08260 [candidate division KSB1 bacterium 4572_119]